MIRWKEIRNKLADINREEQALITEWLNIRAECSHPQLSKYVVDEEFRPFCPDCGYGGKK